MTPQTRVAGVSVNLLPKIFFGRGWRTNRQFLLTSRPYGNILGFWRGLKEMTKIPFFAVQTSHEETQFINLFQVVRFVVTSKDIFAYLSDGKQVTVSPAVWETLRRNNADYLSGLPQTSIR